MNDKIPSSSVPKSHMRAIYQVIEVKFIILHLMLKYYGTFMRSVKISDLLPHIYEFERTPDFRSRLKTRVHTAFIQSVVVVKEIGQQLPKNASLKQLSLQEGASGERRDTLAAGGSQSNQMLK